MIGLKKYIKLIFIHVIIVTAAQLAVGQTLAMHPVMLTYSLQRDEVVDSLLVDTGAVVTPVQTKEDTATIYFNDNYPAQKAYYEKHIEKQDFDKKNWQKITKGIDYNEEELRKLKPGKRISFPAFSFSLSSSAAQIMLIVFVICVIAFVMYKVIGTSVFNSNKSVKHADLFSIEDEAFENLNEYNLEELLKKALDAKEYKLALRVYYLIVIKQLWQKKHIDWRIDKTNNDYLREMFGKPYYTLFAEVTRLYEYLWYGDQRITETDAAMLIPKFKTLLQKIGAEKE